MAINNEIFHTSDTVAFGGYDSISNSIPIGFTFNFYGNAYTQIYIDINGRLFFDDGNVPPSSNGSNTVLPTGPTKIGIYPLWDDLSTPVNPNYSTNGSILTKTIGTAGSRKFIVQWTDMFDELTSSFVGTFQVILYETSNEIHLQYRDSITGSTATIGIESQLSYNQYSYNTPSSSTPGKAFSYTPNGGSYTLNASADYDQIFLTQIGATAPTLSSPANTLVGFQQGDSFSWSSVNNTDTYILTIASDSNFNNIVFQKNDLVTTSYSLTEKLSIGTYYWNIRAKSILNNSSYFGETKSSTYSFEVTRFPFNTSSFEETFYEGVPIVFSNTDGTAPNYFYDYDEGISDPVNIGFNFDFYGTALTTNNVYIGINGMAIFDETDSSELSYNNVDLSVQRHFNYKAIFPFWCDGIMPQYNNASLPTSILTKTIGSSGSRKFIIQWTDFRNFNQPNGILGSYQVILYESSNIIQFQYRGIDEYITDPNWTGPLATGAASTIGIQKDSNTYNQYSYNTPYVIESDKAIRFTPNGSGDYTLNSSATYDPIYLTIPSASSASLTNPSNGSTVSNTTSFSWDAATNGISYLIKVSQNSNMSTSTINDNGIVDLTYTPQSSLVPGSSYYWNIRTFNPVGETRSQTYNFATENSGSVIYLSVGGSASVEINTLSASANYVSFIPINASSSVLMSLDSPLYGLVSSNSSLYTVADDTGRGARIDVDITGSLEISAQIENNADRFVMIKRVSPIMPNPLPLNSRGEPT